MKRSEATTDVGPGSELLEPLVQGNVTALHAGAAGAVVGELVALVDDGVTPLVTFPAQPGVGPMVAQSIIDLLPEHVGRRLLLLFENNDAAKPVVIGMLRGTLTAPPHPTRVSVDDDRVVLTAARQLTMRCGQASITLTSDGKVLISGTFVLSRAAGVNRILGGSVQIN